MTTPIIFANMLPPAKREISVMACVGSGGPCFGNFGGVAIDRIDIKSFPGSPSIRPRFARPRAHRGTDARLSGSLVNPGIERRRLADIQSEHAFRLHGLLVVLDEDHAETATTAAPNASHESAARVGQTRGGKAGQARTSM